MIVRGGVCWVDFGDPRGSAPALRRPVVIIQSDRYNQSLISTVVVVPLSSNTEFARHPGNVFIPAVASGLPKDSVVNVSQPMTVDRGALDTIGETLPSYLIDELEAGLRRVLDL